MAQTALADIVDPIAFAGYLTQATERKSRLLQSPAVVRSEVLDNHLANGGTQLNVPSFQPLADEEESTVTDDDPDVQKLSAGGGTTLAAQTDLRPSKFLTSQETAVRMDRAKAWQTSDIARLLAGADPITALRDTVGEWWAYRQQQAIIATMAGVFADNAAAPGAGEHVQNDLTNSIAGGSYVRGQTDFSAEALIDTETLLGDSRSKIQAIFAHSRVVARMRKLNLIDFIPDSTNTSAELVPVYLGKPVIEDDSMPNPSTGVYETWLLGPGAIQIGMTAGTASGADGVELFREPLAGGGGGSEGMVTRLGQMIHPTGHRYIGSGYGAGGPQNSTGAGPLNAAASWVRARPERKQIAIARLITREF